MVNCNLIETLFFSFFRLIMFKKTAAWLLMASVFAGLVSCATPVLLQKHIVMGSDQKSYPNSVLTLQTETENSVFHLKLFSIKFADCESGYLDYLEFDGIIDSRAVHTFETALVEAQGCTTKKGGKLYPFVYLNSSMGEYVDGYALGELFRRFNIETIVTQGQTCMGACAASFLGGRLRSIEENGSLVFGSSRVRGGGMVCDRAIDQATLREYFDKMLGSVSSDRFYFNLLSNCLQPSGWIVDAFSAPRWNITNE